MAQLASRDLTAEALEQLAEDLEDSFDESSKKIDSAVDALRRLSRKWA